MIKNQKRVYKKLGIYGDRISILEEIASLWLLMCGVSSFVIFIIMIFLDPIRMRPWEVCWLQLIGIGCSMFFSLGSFIMWWKTRG